MKVQLECPVCMNSLFEAAQIDCSTPQCSADKLCSSCKPGPSTAPPPLRKGRKTPANTFAKSTALTDTSVTPCGHLFHSRCLKKWFAESGEKPSCPNCRSPFALTRIYQVYLDYSACGSSFDSSGDPAPGTSGSCSSGGMPPAPAVHSVVDVDNVEDMNVTMYNGHSFEDLKLIHSTLISDFNELKDKYLELREESDLSKAQIMSLECEIDSLNMQLNPRHNVAHIPEPAMQTTKRPGSKQGIQGRGGKRSRSSEVSVSRSSSLD